MNMKIKSNRGFTMMELMIVVVVIGIITAMAVPRFMNAYDRMKFKSYNRDIESSIRMARSLSITEKKNYGLKIDPNDYTVTLFKKSPVFTTLNVLEVGDQIIDVDTLNMGFNWMNTNMTNHTMAFLPNGTVKFDGGGIDGEGGITTLVSTGEMVAWYTITILPATGRVQSGAHYY